MGKNVLANSRRLRRKRFFFRFFLAFFLVFLISVAATISLFFLEKFKIAGIAVSGTDGLSQEIFAKEVESAMATKKFGIIPQNRIFTFPKEAIKMDLIRRFIKIENLEMEIDMGNIVKLDIKERKDAALLCGADNKKCFFLDKTGFVFEEAPFFSDGVYMKFVDERSDKAELGEFFLSPGDMDRVFVFWDRLKTFCPVARVHVRDRGIFVFFTEGGWYLLVDGDADWNTVYANLEISFNEKLKDGVANLEYVDLRFDNKVFYREK